MALSGNAFADKSNDTSSKMISIKSLADRQGRLAVDLTMLDAKLADKAGSSNDKNVIDQASLVRKALGEAKQASDDLTQANQLTKSVGNKKSTGQGATLGNGSNGSNGSNGLNSNPAQAVKK
jgi:hypothetical protein